MRGQYSYLCGCGYECKGYKALVDHRDDCPNPKFTRIAAAPQIKRKTGPRGMYSPSVIERDANGEFHQSWVPAKRPWPGIQTNVARETTALWGRALLLLDLRAIADVVSVGVDVEIPQIAINFVGKKRRRANQLMALPTNVPKHAHVYGRAVVLLDAIRHVMRRAGLVADVRIRPPGTWPQGMSEYSIRYDGAGAK